jgi:hypothetical protein
MGNLVSLRTETGLFRCEAKGHSYLHFVFLPSLHQPCIMGGPPGRRTNAQLAALLLSTEAQLQAVIERNAFLEQQTTFLKQQLSQYSTISPKPVSGSLKKWDPLRDPKFWQSNKVENSKPKLFLGCQQRRTGTSGSTSQMIINVETCVLVPVSMLLGPCTNWPRWLQRSSYSDEEVVARLSD